MKTATTAVGVAATEQLITPLLRSDDARQESQRPKDQGVDASIAVKDLCCESTVNPLGIDAATPTLRWFLASSEKGQKQTAYQILVASDEAKLRNEQPDIWDSGRVDSDQSTQVAYGGPTLLSRRRYFWKVRAWDEDGAASSYSEAAWWEMALLSPQDWKAEWVGFLAGWPGRAHYFRCNFTSKKTVGRARIYVSGLGYYELSLNGSKVGDHVLDPGVTNYAKRILYSTYDVTNKLNDGSNTIGVIVGNGWYGVPRLILQCEITYADGSIDTVYTHQGYYQDPGGRWLVTSGPILENSTYSGETYDARLEKDGWDTPIDSSVLFSTPLDRTEGWAGIHSVPLPGGAMAAQAVNPIKIVDSLRPRSMSEPRPGVFVFDIGQNMAGWAHVQVSGARGTRVVLKFGETLLEDGTIDQTNLFTAAATDVYILKGKGTESWEPRFTYHGFRFVQLEGFPGKPSLDTLTAKVVRSSVEPSGTIETSNDLINRIQKMILWTEASNLYSIPTDCPQRSERMGWMNDLTVRAEEAIYNFDMSRFYPKFLNDINDTQRVDGAISDTVPFGWGQRPADPVSTSYLLLGWFAYQHYNDTRVLAEHFDGFKAWTDFLHSKTKDNIVTYGYYGDWSPPRAFAMPGPGSNPISKDTPLEFMSTGYLYYDAWLISHMAQALGKTEDKAKYTEMAQQVAASFNSRYWNESAGGYGSNNEAMDSFALFLGIVPEDKIQRVVASLVKAVHDNGDHLSTGNLCTKYVMEALTKYGHGDLAFKIATQETYPSWGYMLANGATTLWERWESLTGPGMNSHNHPMMGSVSAWFHKYLGGINPDPDMPGFKHIIIRPYPLGDLRWVRAEYKSSYGLIRSSWSKDNDLFILRLTVPVNTTAKVYIPARDGASITLNRKQAAMLEGVKLLGRQEGTSVFEVGSGDYEFAAK
ncbi:MAG: glycoside hydrolase family 78 protein [Terracidiphilus sp.]